MRRSLTLKLGGPIRFYSFERDYIQRDSVQLTKSTSSYDHYNKYALLSLSTIRVPQLEALKKTFPHIRLLQISASEKDKVHSACLVLLVTNLLECWSANLSALHIFTEFRLINPHLPYYEAVNMKAMNRIYLCLFNIINRMCHLRSIIFCTKNILTLQSFHLPIIAQLEVFYFSPNYVTSNPHWPMLNLLSKELLKYGAPQLKSVGLETMITLLSDQCQLRQLVSDRSNRHFLAKLTHLSIAIFQESDIDYFVDMLYPLRGTLFSLSIHYHATLPLLIATITKLRPLIESPESRIECLKLRLLYNLFEVDQLFEHSPDNSSLTKQFIASISLPSIRHLYITIDKLQLTDENVKDFEKMFINWRFGGIFPNLKVFDINGSLLIRRENARGVSFVSF